MNACSKKDRQAQRIEEWRKRNQKFIGTNEPTSSSNSSLLSVNLFPAPYKINRGDEISSRLQNTLGRYDEMKDVLIHQCNQCYLVGVSHPPNHQAADQSIPAFPEKPSSSLRAPHSFRKGESFSEYDYSQVGEPCKISLESSTIQAATKRLCGQMFDSGKMGCGSIQDTGSKASRSLERSNIRRQHSSMGAAALPIWKPTAYVRPMDGQDLVTIEVTCRGENVSPGQLKPDQPESLLTRDVYSQGDNGNLTTLVRLHTDNVKSPQPEIGFFNTDCVENILREMTHSWPPLLAALPSASSSQSSKLSHSQLPTKENHLNSRHKRGGNLTKEPAWETDVDKSFLEDDLKLSSDEDEITQVLEQVSPFCSPFRHRARLQHFDESSSGEDHTCDISNAMSFELGSNMKPLHNSSGKTNPNWVHQSQSASRHIASDASTPIHDAAEASCSSGGGGSGDFAELTDLSVSGTSSDSHESDSESSSNSSGERNMNNTTRDNSPENVRDRQEHRKKSRWNVDTEKQKISLSQPACSPSHISISDRKSNSSKLAGEKDKWRKTTSSSSYLQPKPYSKPHKAEAERRESSVHQPLKAEPLTSRKFEAPLKRPEREQGNVKGTASTLKNVPIPNGCGRQNGSMAEVTPGKSKSTHPTEHHCATIDLSTPLQNGHRKEKRSRIMLDNMVGSLDQRLQEARKLKHKADNMVDPSWKAVTYMQAALFYIECGIVMEEDSIEAKMVYNMYCKTLEIIRHAISLQKFATSNASSNDKKLSTICYRCLSLLYLHLFCFKKDSALKYSKILMDHFKNTSLTARAQSPGKDRATTTLCSPLLDTSTSATAGPRTLSIPQYVVHMTTSHLHITNQLLHSYNAWEQAEALAKENIEFFHKLDAAVDALTLTSGLRVLVQHSRTGLHWLQAEKAQT
uniref:AF4/FMR2 family member 3-like isoform X2 n=1 Tax=Myxine glutinosa TaxID=7769 RepID=UPI00358E6158